MSLERDIASEGISGGNPYDGNGEEICGCRLLWRAIIAQSIMDAMGNCKRTELQMAKTGALHWLTSNSKNFTTVCALAGYDPAVVRAKVLKLTKEKRTTRSFM